MIDIIIENGKIVFPDYTLDTSIAIDEGVIVALGSSAYMQRADRVVDAGGKIVIPGGIDPHCHINSQFMGVSSHDDYETATMAAALGGTTTTMDFATQTDNLPLDAVKDRVAEADPLAVVDYCFHSCVTSSSDETMENLKEVIEYGAPSFKMFMVYRKEGVMMEDGAILGVLEQAKKHGGLPGFHSENVSIIEHLREKAIREGNTDAIYHALTRPNISEYEAISRVVLFARYYGVPVYDYHMSCKEGVDLMRRTRKEGFPAYAETCTHYLLFTKEKLKGPDGKNFILSPALRDQEDIDALWRGLADGSVSTVGSDNATWNLEMKSRFGDSFDVVPNGAPGVEFRVPMLFSEGVQKGRLTLNRFVEVTSTNCAKIMGLYPRKGVLNVGSDADVVIIDPKMEKVATTEESPYGMDWYPYEGMTMKGVPVMTISRGKVVYEDGVFQGEPGEGRFLKRRLDPGLFTGVIA
jgi:dihydropyrimidinase